jgi:hypothetical protein
MIHIPRLFLLLPLLAALLTAQPDAPWTELSPEDKAFTIQFPGTPVKQVEKIKTPTGTIDVISYALKPSKDRPAYLLSYSEFAGQPDKLTPQQRLDKAQAGALASTKGKLQSQKNFTLQGYPGRELLIATPEDQHLRTQIYVVGDRVYQLIVVGPADQVASKDADKFFDSFKLKPQ